MICREVFGSAAIKVLKKRNKIIAVLFILVLLMLGSLLGAVYYYYSHPSALKSIIEGRVSQFTGATFTIDSLSYSLDPLSVKIEGVVCERDEGPDGFRLQVPELEVEMSLEGRFGDKDLVLKRVHINRPSFRISDPMNLPQLREGRGGTSLLSHILKWFAGIVLFRDVHFQTIELIDGEISAFLGDGLVQVEKMQASVDHKHRVDISCAAKAGWPLHHIDVGSSDLRITAELGISPVGPDTTCRLTAGDLRFQCPAGDLRNMDLSARLSYKSASRSLFFRPLELSVEEIYIKEEASQGPIKLNGRLRGEGSFGLSNGGLDVESLSFTLKDLIELKGALTAGLGAQTTFKLKDLKGYILPERVLALIPLAFKEPMPALTLSGRVGVSGHVGGRREDGSWLWDCDLDTALTENRLSYVSDWFSVTSLLTGGLKAVGEFPDIVIHSTIEGHKSRFSAKTVDLDPFSYTISLMGKYPSFAVNNLFIDIPRVSTQINKKNMHFEHIRVDIPRGSLEMDKRAILLPKIDIGSPHFRNIHLSFIMEGKDMNIGLQGTGTGLFDSAHTLNLLPSGWRMSGIDSIRMDASLKEKRDLSFAATLELRKLGFEDQDSVFIGENISLDADILGQADLEDSWIRAKASIKSDGGEILLDRFYQDLKQHTLHLSCEGDYSIRPRALRLSDFSIGFKDIGEIDVTGTVVEKRDKRKVDLSLSFPRVPIAPLFRHFLVEPFGSDIPLFSDLQVKGTISAEMRLTSDGKIWEAKGPLSWIDGSIASGEGAPFFNGIDLELPIWYMSEQGHAKRNGLRGELSVQVVNLPFLPKQSLSLGLDVGPNALSVGAPTFLRVPGGKLRIGPLKGDDLFGPQRSIETGLTIDSIDLNPLLAKLWSKETPGRIRGKLEPILYKANDLKTHGHVKAEVFGGTITISDINLSGILTSAPVIKANAFWRDIALAELTSDTPFGRIEGILEGYAKNLEFAYGEPQRFDLLLQTIKRSGVPQKVSVKAVDNIALIGGGQSPFVGLAGKLAALFKEFPYEKIGVHAYLENDAFEIHGTVVENGREYLVKRSGFSGINVVNQNPGVRIGFKEMIKRVKQVTAGTGKPTVGNPP
ncbi:MAG: hypothetical protein V2J25_16585 [Desulfatiglans sp.]|jgi:hypothetical protein|nr:hypothetical protein [Desulfatiglans sp.]